MDYDKKDGCVQNEPIWNVALLAGSNRLGFHDGPLNESMFRSISSLLCTYDGKELLVCDSGNERIRSVCIMDEKNSDYGTVKTVVEKYNRDLGFVETPTSPPPGLCLPRTLTYTTSKIDSVVIISCKYKNKLYDTKTQHLSTLTGLQCDDPNITFTNEYTPIARARLSDNLLIATIYSGIYAMNLQTRRIIPLAGGAFKRGYANGSALETALFHSPSRMCVEGNGSSVIVSDDNAIRRLTLPPVHLLQ